ncbi:lymphatic vessel endothelial hyaluronic receptor 1b [Rhincodon typus]|uniref:lymphatic vessel endothelial hyaluronic receptor 1b n=1 Tax=Rhincodon typus TaxID=259920 RepID=UPI0009A3DDC0|nr:lymphatic vessel endothelial hyaluronic receptor 1b [Rhincodon typus]
MNKWRILILVALSQMFLALTQTSIDVKDVEISQCHIMGIFHISLKGVYNLSLVQAHNACKQLDSLLATKAQVERAHQLGFEMCRYGWVDDGFVVIPRISSKEQCGKNGTGVLVWKVDPDKSYDGYCFQKNDAKKMNTCELSTEQVVQFMNPTETSLTDLGHTNTNNGTEFSFESITPLDSRTLVPWETNTFLSTSTDSIPQSTPSSESLCTTEKSSKDSSNLIIFLALSLVAFILFVIFVATLVYCLRKRKKQFSYLHGQPKEAIEAEVWSNNLIENSSP